MEFWKSSVLLLAMLGGGCTGLERYSALPHDADAAFAEGADLPPTAMTLYRLGRLLAAQGRVEESRATLSACLERYPDFKPASCELAALHVSQRQFDAAIAVLEQGMRRAPDDPVLRNDLGMCLLLCRRYEEALAHFEAAVKASPRDARYRSNLALAAGMLGWYEECLALYGQVLGASEAHYNLAVIMQARGDERRAEAEFRRAAAQDASAGDRHGAPAAGSGVPSRNDW